MSKRSIKEAISKMLECYEQQETNKVKLLTEQLYLALCRIEEIGQEGKIAKRELSHFEYRALQNELSKIRSNTTTLFDKITKVLPEMQDTWDDGGLNEFS